MCRVLSGKKKGNKAGAKRRRENRDNKNKADEEKTQNRQLL